MGQTEPQIRSFSQIFADVCRVSLFSLKLEHSGGADFRRKPQKNAGFRRKTQETAEFRRNPLVPCGLSLSIPAQS